MCIMIYGTSNFKIRKLPEKMISINFLSINADYVSIFIQESEAGLLFFLKWFCREEGGVWCRQAGGKLKPWRCTIYVIYGWEMNWVIYWKTESQEDWISIVQPRASIHQDPINNLTIES